MPTSTAAASIPDAETIRSLVAEVVRRLRDEMKPALTVAPAAERASSPASSETTAPVVAGVLLPGRVVSLAMLEKLPAGTSRVAIEAGAVVTPSAREYARDKGIVIDRATAGSQKANVPFIVTRAECVRDATAQAAALTRGIPGSVQLPATGLADVVAALALHASRDAARGILLTSQPVVATVLANRSASLRAVTARDPSSLAAASTDAAANLLVIDPASFSIAALQRMATDLATRAAPEVPAALAARPAGCGCKGH